MKSSASLRIYPGMTKGEMVELVEKGVLYRGFQAGHLKDTYKRQGIKWELAKCSGTCGIDKACQHCPAMLLASKGGCNKSEFLTGNLLIPRKWKTPRMAFVCPQGDLFHDDIHQRSIAQVFAIMDTCPYHLFIMLTKRERRMVELLSSNQFRGVIIEEGAKIFGEEYTLRDDWGDNLLVGVSVGEQQRIDRLSVLPDLPKPITRVWFAAPMITELHPPYHLLKEVEWCVCNQERGGTYSRPRPCKLWWKRDLQMKCWEAGVPFFLQDRLTPKMMVELGDGPLREYPRHKFFQKAD